MKDRDTYTLADSAGLLILVGALMLIAAIALIGSGARFTLAS